MNPRLNYKVLVLLSWSLFVGYRLVLRVSRGLGVELVRVGSVLRTANQFVGLNKLIH